MFELLRNIYLEQAIELSDMIFDNNLDKIYFLKQYKDECVLNYIHKSDGKKRI